MHCTALQTVALQDKNEVYMLAHLVFLRKKKKNSKKKQVHVQYCHTTQQGFENMRNVESMRNTLK